jgi:SAM-dependent methyltransferase
MPRIARTILPRIRDSIARRGIATSLRRAALLPVHLFREYRAARRLTRGGPRSNFDLAHGVDTDGEHGGWTYLSDLNIASPNWIHGVNYCGVEPARFLAAIKSVGLRHEDYVFIDFGSGKGRALLLASEFPFRKVIGLEFSPELNAIAERNIAIYRRGPSRCAAVETRCMDFVDFVLPNEPSLLYFYEPCDDELLVKVLANICTSLRDHPRRLHVIYIGAGRKQQLLDASGFLAKKGHHTGFQFAWYEAIE